MSQNPNETYPYDVIHATRWSKAKAGVERPTRLVVLKFRKTEGWKYAVRWQTPSGDNGPTYGGASYPTEQSAHEAFMRKYLENNELYKKGNPSHLPGVAK